jgi:hypothetical protein
MKATSENIGQTFKIRIVSHKSFRHYGGREITSTANFVNAVLDSIQDSDRPFIMTLLDSCAGFNKGHKIAVSDTDFDIK